MKHVKTEYADVAQLAEQLICNQQVNGSSPWFHPPDVIAIMNNHNKWTCGDSNPGPTGYEPVALTN